MENRRIAVRGVIIQDNKLFCVRQKNYNGNAVVNNDTYWCTPGGGVDIGEPLIPALERELMEELGVKPIIGNLLYVQQFALKNWEHMEFFFHVTNGQDYLEVDLDTTTHGSTEIAEFDFIDPSSNRVLPEFFVTETFADDAANFRGTKFFNFLD